MAKHSSAGDHSSSSTVERAPERPEVLSPKAADDLLTVSGLARADLERTLLACLRQQGYQLANPAAGDADSVLMLQAGRRLLLQFKHWKARKITEGAVRELYGQMADHDAACGMLVTSGTITLEASRFAGFAHIQLIDVPRLQALLRPAASASAATDQTGRHRTRGR